MCQSVLLYGRVNLKKKVATSNEHDKATKTLVNILDTCTTDTLNTSGMDNTLPLISALLVKLFFKWLISLEVLEELTKSQRQMRARFCRLMWPLVTRRGASDKNFFIYTQNYNLDTCCLLILKVGILHSFSNKQFYLVSCTKLLILGLKNHNTFNTLNG